MKWSAILGYVSVSIVLGACIAPKRNIESGGIEDGILTTDNSLLGNATFSGKSYLPWTTSFTSPGAGSASIKDGAFCLQVDSKGVNNWDAQFRHREMVIMRGHKYYLQFKIWSSTPVRARMKVGMAGPPYAEYWFETVKVTEEPRTYSASFLMKGRDDPTAEFAFHVGGGLAGDAAEPYTICIDDVILADPEFQRPKDDGKMAVPNILVNQVGYFPDRAKIAVLKTDAPSPVKWTLVDAADATVMEGETVVHGPDAASGDSVHIIDFTGFDRPGKGYRLKVGKNESHPFRIDTDIYQRLKYDALHFFYHQRQGVPIEAEYVGDLWARPAGHTGDVSVGCLPKDRYFGKLSPYSGCSYKLDVSGGWYDAGDHGKYIVNGGITTWIMLDEYERDRYLGSSVDDFGDGKLRIPENHNGVPDILDEARFNLEFMLKMQVPDGNPLAGMVHHKIHDDDWTSLGTRPDQDEVARYLHPPTTTATLNLAAAAAVGARVFKEFDPAFASKCLKAAEKAWAAAKAHPDIWPSDDRDHGGGAYGDTTADDEFYWAAAELFITTGKDVYRSFVTKSPWFKKVPVLIGFEKAAGTYTWRDLAPLGSFSLATVPNGLSPQEIEEIRGNIVKAADGYIDIIQKEGYRLPFSGDKDGRYPWGANSFVIDALVVIARGYDFSKDPRHLDAVVTGMDYLMGRNPMDTVYVTGYGTRPVMNPHHRFWAKQADSAFPPPPPGVLSGGPNSGVEDPYAKAAGLEGCAPEKCFIDHIESWSTNEIAINWNAPLAWVAAFLDEKGGEGDGGN